ncbi:MAG: sigma-70 family RNA polymerase sigma factor [Gemmatimonadaceae bacterium]|nr:sigma-70 family RNA polymerase sigma factor [Gemmatimonadaceae bacterium]
MTRPPVDDRLAAVPTALPADLALVARVRACEQAAERELFDQYAPGIYRLIYRLTGRAEQAQDWTQDTFIRAFSRLHQFRGEASLATWLRTIAVSVTRNRMETVLRREQYAASMEEAESVASPETATDPDLRERLEAAIAALPAGTRAVYVLHDLEGYTHDEISAQLGIVEGTSKSQLSKARARLRAALAPFRNSECA